MRVIDMYAGAGGLSEGLKNAGIDVVAANEIRADAAATYSYNHPETHLFVKDIRKLRAMEITDVVGKEIDAICGGPPCAGFSMLGKRNPSDPRNKLFLQFLRIVKDIKPSFFLMENVEGLLSMQGGKTVKIIEGCFRGAGYNVSRVLVDASHFGVPQVRRRVLIFGSLDSGPDISELKPPKNVMPVGVASAISDLDFLKPGEKSEEYIKPARTRYQKFIRHGSKKLCNHQSSKHCETVVKKFSTLMQGDSAKNLPKKYRTGKQIMYRLSAKYPAKTVTTMPDDYVHYRANRILTVRELARLQSFRDTYLFKGQRTSGGLRRRTSCPQYTQVGNSVPPLLSTGVGLWMKCL